MSEQGDKGTRPPTEGETEPQAGTQAQVVAKPEAESDAPVSGEGLVWVRVAPSQVMRTVAVALLTAAVVLGAFFVLWQLRTFVAWFLAALFLAAVLNPAVNWFQRRHRMIKRPLAIVLVYLGVVVALLFMVGILLPVLVDQIRGLINFATTVAQAPEGPTKYLQDLARQNGLGSVFNRFSDQIDNVRGQLKDVASNALLSTGGIVVGIAGLVAALVTVLTLTFFLILGSERYLNASVGLFAERHQPLVRRLLTQSGGAVTGYVTGNLTISVICGITTFVVLEVLGMPYAAALALLVAVLDLIPLGWRDAGRGITRNRGVLRRAVEGPWYCSSTS